MKTFMGKSILMMDFRAFKSPQRRSINGFQRRENTFLQMSTKEEGS
jgi:hypothetical protein